MLRLILCALLLSTFAQGQVGGRLVIADSSAVPYASVLLVKSTDSMLVRSALSDKKGNFSMAAAPYGTYLIKIISMGYIPYTSPTIVIDSAQRFYDAGTIMLKVANHQLSEVVIRSTKPLIAQQLGGLVVNPQNSLMTRGSSVLQVLSRSPGVVINAQNNAISLNGKSGVMVMLDGKLLRLPADHVATLLQDMRADDIDKIELLTTPPAKYDADGNAGLINIITQKSKQPGTSGSLTASAGYGRGEKASANISLNHNSGKLSLHASYSYNRDRSYGLLLAKGTENAPIIGGQTTLDYHSQSKPLSNYNSFSGGFGYRASDRTMIGGNIDYSIGTYQNNSHNFGSYALTDSSLNYSSFITGTSHTYYFHPSVYLEHAISKYQKLNLDLDYFDHTSNSPTQVQSNFSDSLFKPTQRNLANSNIKVGVAALDYSNSFSKQLKLESGLKGTYTYTQSVAGIENLVGAEWVPVGAGTSNDLATREAIGAAYVDLNWQLDSLTTVFGGARFEYSRNTTAHSLNAQYFVDRSLGKLFPSVFITRKLNPTDELQLSYTERISRPSFADLASYVAYNDPVSVFTGNPALKPTITDNLKLAYNTHDFLFSLLYSRDTNPILGTQVMPGPTSGLIYLTPENADWQNNLVLQTTIPVKATNWWRMNYGFIGGYHQYKISYYSELLQKSYYSYSFNFTESFKPTAHYAIELSGYYNSPSYSGDSRSNGIAIFNLDVKKELSNQNGSFKLSISDLFRGASYQNHIGQLVTDNFNSNVETNYQAESHNFPIIKLSYSRSFGSNTKKAQHNNSGTKAEQNRL
ncbi:TonB dependent receptor [Mucilaginibacter xinganensis]|nr:TonB dependent receptor [Mucilaginibacter xinganensis]